MASSTFNAITYANKLKNAGLDVKIADVQAEEMSDFINNTLATKMDLISLRKDIKADMDNLEHRMYSFIIKSTIATVSFFVCALTGAQILLHFFKIGI